MFAIHSTEDAPSAFGVAALTAFTSFVLSALKYRIRIFPVLSLPVVSSFSSDIEAASRSCCSECTSLTASLSSDAVCVSSSLAWALAGAVFELPQAIRDNAMPDVRRPVKIFLIYLLFFISTSCYTLSFRTSYSLYSAFCTCFIVKHRIVPLLLVYNSIRDTNTLKKYEQARSIALRKRDTNCHVYSIMHFTHKCRLLLRMINVTLSPFFF